MSDPIGVQFYDGEQYSAIAYARWGRGEGLGATADDDVVDERLLKLLAQAQPEGKLAKRCRRYPGDEAPCWLAVWTEIASVDCLFPDSADNRGCVDILVDCRDGTIRSKFALPLTAAKHKVAVVADLYAPPANEDFRVWTGDQPKLYIRAASPEAAVRAFLEEADEDFDPLTEPAESEALVSVRRGAQAWHYHVKREVKLAYEIKPVSESPVF